MKHDDNVETFQYENSDLIFELFIFRIAGQVRSTMVGTKSPIWNFFDKNLIDPSTVTCKKCKTKVSRGSRDPKKMTNSNMMAHLRNKHKDLMDDFKEKDKENNERKRKAEDEKEQGNSSLLKNKKQKTDFLQQTLPESIAKAQVWNKDHPNAVEGHKRVLLMIIMDLKPYSDVNKGGLLQLIKFLQPKFELGSDKLYREMMQDAYGRCRESMQKKIKDDNPEQISIVLDGWSSTHHGYVGVNVHYIGSDWKRVKINIGCKKFDESHTGAAMAKFIEELTQVWDIYYNISIGVTDSAANMIKMFEYLPWQHVDCGNHSFQLVLNDEIFTMVSVETLVKKCRAVCTYGNKSWQFTQDLIKAQATEENQGQGKYLVQDVVTRWNSTYLMLERFLLLKPFIIKVLGSQKWEEKVSTRFYPNEWELMSKIVTMVKGFKEATEMLSSAQASISQIIPVVKLIKESMKSTSNDQGVKKLKAGLLKSLETRFGHKEFDKKFSHATVLDPRYKTHFFNSTAAKDAAVAGVISELKQAIITEEDESNAPLVERETEEPTEESFTLQALMKKVIAEKQVEEPSDETAEGRARQVVSAFLSIPVEEKECLGFWREYEEKAKNEKNSVKLKLAKLAKKYLSPPPTSTDVERLFSIAGSILTDERNRLLPDNLDKLLFLKQNIQLLNFKL